MNHSTVATMYRHVAPAPPNEVRWLRIGATMRGPILAIALVAAWLVATVTVATPYVRHPLRALTQHDPALLAQAHGNAARAHLAAETRAAAVGLIVATLALVAVLLLVSRLRVVDRIAPYVLATARRPTPVEAALLADATNLLAGGGWPRHRVLVARKLAGRLAVEGYGRNTLVVYPAVLESCRVGLIDVHDLAALLAEGIARASVCPDTGQASRDFWALPFRLAWNVLGWAVNRVTRYFWHRPVSLDDALVLVVGVMGPIALVLGLIELQGAGPKVACAAAVLGGMVFVLLPLVCQWRLEALVEGHTAEAIAAQGFGRASDEVIRVPSDRHSEPLCAATVPQNVRAEPTTANVHQRIRAGQRRSTNCRHQ